MGWAPPFDTPLRGLLRVRSVGAGQNVGFPLLAFHHTGMVAHVYILRCADDSYYVGSTRKPIEHRLYEHASGLVDGYTARRRPVVLVWARAFERHVEAFQIEKQLKGWSRRKKEALIRGDWNGVSNAARSYQHHGGPDKRRT